MGGEGDGVDGPTTYQLSFCVGNPVVSINHLHFCMHCASALLPDSARYDLVIPSINEQCC